MKSKFIVIMLVMLFFSSILVTTILTAKSEEKLQVVIKYKENSKEAKFLAKNVDKEYNKDTTLKKVTQKQYEKLLEDNSIEQVWVNGPVYAFLSETHPIINSTGAYNLQVNDLNLTGQGQTICVVDSGINYSHPDLGNCNIKNTTLNGINFSYIKESTHPYADDIIVSYKINYTGFTNIAVHFVNMSVEPYYDNITILDENNNSVKVYTGIRYDEWSPSVSGDTMYIRIQGDSSVNDYGFYIDQVINGSATTTYNWSGCNNIIGGYDIINEDEDPMDDHGHGTHVAGIVAANGNINGIAKGANIVAVKSLNNDGSSASGTRYDIRNGIQWCVNNSDEYNISVISLSLGSSNLFNSYCDGDAQQSIYVDAIANAVAANIAVVAASGNDGNTTHIASPACIQNVIPVGNVYDADVGSVTWSGTCTDSSTIADQIVCHANRNSLVQLFAPGAMINSTYIPSGYAEEGGTSMATPVVAGTIAIIKQLLDLTSQTKTPQEIETVLYNTGKIINDSGNSNINYSRINVFRAVFSLDNINPEVNLISPQDNVLISEGNKTFNCNASDWKLDNLTFYLWNSTGSLIEENITSSTSDFVNQLTDIANLTEDTYYWTCQACDNNSNCFSASNYTLPIGNIATSLVLPLNNGYTNSLETFNCSAQSATNLILTNITLMVWDDSDNLFYSASANITGTSNYSTFNRNLNTDGSYKWNCLGFDNQSDSKFAISNRTITYDDTNPDVTLLDPDNNEDAYEEDENIDFEYEVEDDNAIENCSLLIDDDIEDTDSTVTRSTSQDLTYSFSTDGDYTWKIECYDIAGNKDTSSTRDIEIQEASNDGGSGSSSSGWVYASDLEEEEEEEEEEDKDGSTKKTTTNNKIYNPNRTELKQGYTQKMNEGEIIRFVITIKKTNNNIVGYASKENENDTEEVNQTHTLTIDKINPSSVELTIKSDPIKLNMTVGEEQKVNLSSPDKYDVSVKLNSINNSEANITITELDEEVSLWTKLKAWNKANYKATKEWVNNYKTWIIVVIIIIGLFIINDMIEYQLIKRKNNQRIRVLNLPKNKEK